MNSSAPYIIGIAGGSGSGKTTVIQKILEVISKTDTVIFQHDWYYRDNPHLCLEDRSKLNYDHPDSLETSLLINHLEKIIGGRAIEAPQYDFSIHLRKEKTKPLAPQKVVLVDGILILQNEELRKLMDLKLYVDTDPDLRFIRRMERDIQERGRTRDSVVHQYLNSVKPMHDLYVEPSKRFADIIVPHGGQNSVAINVLIAKIESHIRNTEQQHVKR